MVGERFAWGILVFIVASNFKQINNNIMHTPQTNNFVM